MKHLAVEATIVRHWRPTRKTHGKFFERLLEKQVSQNFVAVLRQFVLLLLAAVVFEAKNNRIFRCDERSVSNCVNNISEENVRAHSFAVCNYRFLVLSFAIPTIQFDAPSRGTTLRSNISG